MLMPEFIVFAVGLIAAIRGADWVGNAAVKWAEKFGVSHVFIGATLVSIATTLPELSIATISGIFNHDSQIALGAVLGSPLANLGLILGGFFLFSQVRPNLGYYSRAVNVFLVSAFLLLILSFYQPLGGYISLIFIVLGIVFLIFEFTIGNRSISLVENTSHRFQNFFHLFSFAKDKALLFQFILGAILLAVGSKYVVDSTVAISSLLQINELFISLTLLAFGTSLPELITAVNSIIYKREGVSVGNLVGASVIDVTLGVGLGTVLTSTVISFPTNLFIFLPMLVMGALALVVISRRIPITLIGSLLIATAIISLVAFSIYEIL